MKRFVSIFMALILILAVSASAAEVGLTNFTTTDMEGNIVTQDIFADYDLTMVNSGAAWVIAREENAKLETSLIPVEGGLCARLGIRNENTFPYHTLNSDLGDGYHEGDIGGGQFLNACVWYETITGQSCLDNPYKPTKENGKYELSDEFAALLRNAAHSVGQK